MKPPNALACIVLAGSLTTAAPAQFTVTLTADDTLVAIGDTITWTLTVTDGITAATHLQAYDLNLIASDETLGTASPLETALSPLVNPDGGSATGASLFGVTGGQSRVLDPLGTIYGSPVIVGTFQVVAELEGQLTYALADGGVLSADHFRHRDAGDWIIVHDGPPDALFVNTVTIVPAPAGTLALVTIGLVSRRRRT